jgi:release factor glutamine methyltransferase
MPVVPVLSLTHLVDRLRAAGCVFAEDEAALLMASAREPDELAALLARRVAGTPLEQVLGWAEFCGLRIRVEPGVFVPRRRTEFLVRQAAAVTRPGAVVVDLCCGSGAVGAALGAALESAPGRPAELYAVDIEPAAVRCARHNIAEAAGQVYLGDLYTPLPAALRGRVGVLVANAPYVPTEAIALLPPEARDHEPRVALDGGTDGAALHRRVAAGALEWLAPGGRLLIETSERQAALTARAVTDGGLDAEVVSSEELDATVVIGVAPDRRLGPPS